MAMIDSWKDLKALALSLDLPRVTEAVSWGNESLKAHGKLWTWWSPMIDAAVFKGPIEEREMLMQVDPGTFVLHPHYATSNVILVAAGRLDPEWAKARLVQSWRDMAPKRVLAQYDAEHGSS